MSAEGWYVDPYGVHEARWISGGRPTSLVRDAALESDDEPPADAPAPTSFQPLPVVEVAGGADLQRADTLAAGDQSFSAADAAQAATGSTADLSTGAQDT